MKRKFIFLIISCSDLNKNNVYYSSQDKYNFFKKINKLYYDLFQEQIHYFFVEYNKDIDSDIIEDGNFIYVKGVEEPIIPNMLVKKMLAIKYIQSIYDYDFMVHTNLTSIWNIPILLSLYNKIPKTNFFGGHFVFNSFISGTGIIISKDLTNLLLQIPVKSYNDNEDVAISKFMQQNGIYGYHLENLTGYKMNYQIVDHEEQNKNSPHHKIHNLEINESTQTDDILYFRIRNSTQQQDIFVVKNIIKNLYNISV